MSAGVRIFVGLENGREGCTIVALAEDDGELR